MGEPILVGQEIDSELVIIDPEIAVASALDRIGPQRLHLLRDHADIGLVAADVAEPIVAKAVVEVPEQNHVMLQCKVGATSTSATSAATTSAETAATSATTESATARGNSSSPTASHARHAGSAARGLDVGCPARLRPKRVLAPTAPRSAGGASPIGWPRLFGTAALPSAAVTLGLPAAGPIACTGAIAATTIARAGAITSPVAAANAIPAAIASSSAIAATITNAVAAVTAITSAIAARV
jgi:hypothetical protein